MIGLRVRLCALIVAALLFPSAPSDAQPEPPADAGAPDGPDGGTAARLQPPRLLHFVDAPAPPALAERGQVDVILTLDVDASGQVTAAVVAESGGDAFDQAAITAAKQFRFAPGEVDGKPVPVRVTFRYRFVLKQAPAAAASPGSAPPGAPAAPATVPLGGVVESRGDRIAQPGIT